MQPLGRQTHRAPPERQQLGVAKAINIVLPRSRPILWPTKLTFCAKRIGKEYRQITIQPRFLDSSVEPFDYFAHSSLFLKT